LPYLSPFQAASTEDIGACSGLFAMKKRIGLED